ncbi:MAG: 5'-nucleotidase C-terminal domain-containing protein [Clostridiaceae bacterium]
MKRKNNLKFFSLFLVLLFSFALLPVKMASAATSTAKIDYYSINDFHGNVDSTGSSSNPGLARLQTYLKSQIALNPNSYFLSSGDQYQGTAISNLTYGDVVNDILDKMGMLTSAIGNHEFDWGPEHIVRWAKEGSFQFIAANIEVEESKKPAEWDTYVKPYYIHTVNIDGVDFKIGFIGIATPETAYKTAAANVEGFTFTDPIVATNNWTTYLKETEGVDAVIALTHLSAFQDLTTKIITGEVVSYANGIDVDAIFSAHSHQIVNGTVNGIPVVQGLYNARSLSKISLSFDVVDAVKTLTVTSAVIDIKALIKTTVEDAEIKKIVDDYYTILSPILNEKLAELKNDLPHDTSIMQLTPMGQFVSKAMTEIAGTQIAIVNGGGVRRGFEIGTITMGLMYELLPFDNTLVTLKLTGADLKKVIEHGIMPATFKAGQFYGLDVTYNPEAVAGSRITKITLLDGTPIEDTAVYTVATIDFLLTGGDKYNFSAATDVVDTMIPLREKIAEYIKAKAVIETVFEDDMHAEYIPKMVNVDYFSINNFHGNVDSLGSSKNPGLTKIQTYLDKMRVINSNTYLLSSGSHFQGKAASNSINENFTGMKLLASALGNYEFAGEPNLILNWAKAGGYVYLASNIEIAEETKPVDWDTYVVPYLIQEIVVDGKTIKVGFIGVSTPKTFNANGFTFTDPIEATNKWSKILVEEEGVDAVIALTQLSASQPGTEIKGEIVNYANKITNVDAIFTGNSQQVVSGEVNGIPVVQGGHNGGYIANVTFEFKILGPEITLETATGNVVDLTALTPEPSRKLSR